MQQTVWLTGMLPFMLIAGAVLTTPLALLLLWLYRRAVLRSMALASGVPPPAGEPPAATPGAPLGMHTASADAPPPATAAYRAGQRSLRRLGLVHVVAGLAYAAVFTAAWMIWVTPGFIL